MNIFNQYPLVGFNGLIDILYYDLGCFGGPNRNRENLSIFLQSKLQYLIARIKTL